MNTAISIILVVAIVGVLALIHIGIGYIFTALAEKDKWFTIVPEGTIKTVLKGGNFVKFLENIEGWKIDTKGNSPIIGTARKTKKYEVVPGEGGISISGALYTMYGVHWIGRPPVKNILNYHLRWGKLEQQTKEDGTTSYDLTVRDENVSSIFFVSPYAMEFKNIAVGGNLRMNFKLVISLRTFNPHTQLFQELPHGSWLMIATTEVQSGFINFAGQEDHKYEWFREQSHNIRGSEFYNAMMQLNESLREKAGVEISNAELKDFQLVEDPKVQEQLQALELEKHKTKVAEQAAKTQVKQARGQAKADAILGKGQQDYYSQVGQALDNSPGARTMAVMQKIADSDLRAIGGSITSIINLEETEKDVATQTPPQNKESGPKFKKFDPNFKGRRQPSKK